MYFPRRFYDVDARTEHILFYTEERATTVASVPEATIANKFLHGYYMITFVYSVFFSPDQLVELSMQCQRGRSQVEGAIQLQAAICFRIVQPRLTARRNWAQPHGSRLIVGGWRKPAAWL